MVPGTLDLEGGASFWCPAAGQEGLPSPRLGAHPTASWRLSTGKSTAPGGELWEMWGEGDSLTVAGGEGVTSRNKGHTKPGGWLPGEQAEARRPVGVQWVLPRGAGGWGGSHPGPAQENGSVLWEPELVPPRAGLGAGWLGWAGAIRVLARGTLPGRGRLPSRPAPRGTQSNTIGRSVCCLLVSQGHSWEQLAGSQQGSWLPTCRQTELSGHSLGHRGTPSFQGCGLRQAGKGMGPWTAAPSWAGGRQGWRKPGDQ